MKTRRLPTVRSRRLGLRLRAYREARGWDQSQTARAVGVVQTHISKVESGRSKLDAAKFAKLCYALEISEEDRHDLEAMRARVDEPGWWQEYTSILGEPMQALVELESEASVIRTYDGAVFPGLLQTRTYAEELISASTMHNRVSDIDKHLELRMRRQHRLEQPEVRLHSVVGEAALRQQIGGRSVLLEQLRHVLAMIRENNVGFQVVPFTAGAHAALIEQFVMIQWPKETDPEVVFVDGQTSWGLHESPSQVRQYTHAFASVQSQALSPTRSLELLREVTKELER